VGNGVNQHINYFGSSGEYGGRSEPMDPQVALRISMWLNGAETFPPMNDRN
jgi:hypothetical protein